jgi:hypothetical protein
MAVCALAVPLSAATASAQTIADGRAWFNITAQERAGTASPWRWYAEVQWRYRDGFSDVDQLVVRPAVAYDLTNRSSLWAGYAYVGTYPAGRGAVDENRAWQQYLWSAPAPGGGIVQSRTRLEQRSIEGNDRLSWRARTFARLQKPVASPANLAVVVWDEIFVHLNDTRQTAQGIDQNRFFGGVGLTVAPRARLEAGYLNQAIRGGRAPVNRQNHVVLGFVNVTY